MHINSLLQDLSNVDGRVMVSDSDENRSWEHDGKAVSNRHAVLELSVPTNSLPDRLSGSHARKSLTSRTKQESSRCLFPKAVTRILCESLIMASDQCLTYTSSIWSFATLP